MKSTGRTVFITFLFLLFGSIAALSLFGASGLQNNASTEEWLYQKVGNIGKLPKFRGAQEDTSLDAKHDSQKRETKSFALTMTPLDPTGSYYVSAKQFCMALDCKLIYQWPKSRAIVQNRKERFSAILSHLTHVLLVDGKVENLKNPVLLDPEVGYLFSFEVASLLASRLKLGKIERKKSMPSEQASLKDKNSSLLKKVETIVIDPGHGGNDMGTSHQSLYEKDITLLYARRLQTELKKRLPSVQTFLTREQDQFVSLSDRAKFANKKNAQLFISLHVNHAMDSDIEGLETYILSPDATDDEARKLALLENESWLKSSKIAEAAESKNTRNTVKEILIDVEQTRYIQNSALAAAFLHQDFSSLSKFYGLKSRGVKQAMFYVLSQAAMPSVLIEMGFLSNPEDRARLFDLKFQNAFIEKLVTSIQRYREKISRN